MGRGGGFNSIINLGRPPLENSKHPDQGVLRLPEWNRVHRAHLLLPKPAVLSNEQAVSDAPRSRGPEGPPPPVIYSAFTHSHAHTISLLRLLTPMSAQMVLFQDHAGW